MADACSSEKRRHDGDDKCGKRKRENLGVLDDHAFDTDDSGSTSTDDEDPINEVVSKIFVKTLAGKIYNLKVKPSDTISDVKTKIQYKEGIPSDQQALIFNKRLLADSSSTLADYEIDKESTLTLLLKSRGLMQIFIKSLTGKTFSLKVKRSDIIGSVKAKIHEKEGILPEMQALIFDNMVLEDSSSTLADFDIHKQSTLTLVLKSTGLMQIFVKIPTGKIFTVEVKLSDTIGDVKAQIHDKSGTPPDLQRLTFGLNKLEDGCTIASYHIYKESTLTLVVKSIGLMQIFIKILTNKIYTIVVKLSDTISDVKERIRDASGIPPAHQRLVLGGNQLQDGRTIASYHIYKEATLFLVLRLPT